MSIQNQTDPIIEEIHAIRRAIAERFGNDVHKIAEDARRRQQASGKPVWQRDSSSDAMRPHGGRTDPGSGDAPNATG